MLSPRPPAMERKVAFVSPAPMAYMLMAHSLRNSQSYGSAPTAKKRARKQTNSAKLKGPKIPRGGLNPQLARTHKLDGRPRGAVPGSVLTARAARGGRRGR